jgi:hypothetical protein
VARSDRPSCHSADLFLERLISRRPFASLVWQSESQGSYPASDRGPVDRSMILHVKKRRGKKDFVEFQR